MTHTPPSPQLSRASVARQAFAAAQQIENDWSRSRAVRQMAGVLPPDCLPAALQLARALASPNLRARTLMAVALASPAEDRPARLAEAGAVIQTIASAAGRAGPLSVLAERLGGAAGAEAAEEALVCAAEEAVENERGWLIVALMPHLPAAAQLTALAHLRAITEASIRVPTLAHAARHLPPADADALLADALAQARAIDDAEARARSLAAVLPRLPPEAQAAPAGEALAAAAALHDEEQWARTVQWTAAGLSPQARAEAYRSALALRRVGPRAEALGALALLADEADRPGRLAAALYAAAQVRGDWDRAFALEPLAGALTPQLHAAALAAARPLADPWARSEVLAELTVTMPPDLKTTVLLEALAGARAAVLPWARARALTTVAEKCA